MIVNRYLNFKLGLILLFSTSVNTLLIYSARCCKCCKGKNNDGNGNGNGNGVQKGGNPSGGKSGSGNRVRVTKPGTGIKKELIISIVNNKGITDVTLDGNSIKQGNWDVKLTSPTGIVNENFNNCASVVKIEEEDFESITTDFKNLKVNINDETINKYLCAVVKNTNGSCYIVFSEKVHEGIHVKEVVKDYGLFQSSNNSSIYILKNNGLEDLGYMCYECQQLKNLDLSKLKTNNVTSMRSMFYKCSNLKKLILSSFDTEKVKDMGYLFSGCSRLMNLNVSNFNTQNVTNMAGMFNGCSSLKELDLSNFNTEKVTDMHDMFKGCSSLKELDLSNFKIQKDTETSGIFSKRSSLNKIIVNKTNNNNNLKETIVKSGFKENPDLENENTITYVRQ